MNRFTQKMVLVAFVTACRLAACPTRRSPVLLKATMEGVVRAPSEFSTTTGSPPSMTDMQELVVPRSMPRILAMVCRSLLVDYVNENWQWMGNPSDALCKSQATGADFCNLHVSRYLRR